MADKIRIQDSDDEDTYAPTDSEEEYSEEEKEILEEIRKGRKKEDDGKRELLAFADSDEDDDDDDDEEEDQDEMMGDSDIEGAEDDDDLPDAMDWGKNKRNYYNTDFVDPDYDDYNEEQEELALAEEEEAKAIQQRLAKQMNEDDFNLEEMFGSSGKADDDEDKDDGEPSAKKSKIKISKADFANLTKRERLQMFKKDSPEFHGLVKDYLDYYSEATDLLEPVNKYVKENNLPLVPAFQYAAHYQHLILMYCMNINFYLVLKANKTPIKYHPVTKRLYQFKTLLKQMEEKYTTIVKPQLEDLLKMIKSGEEITITDPSVVKKAAKNKKLKIMDAYKEPVKKVKTKAKKVAEELEDDSEVDQENEDLLEKVPMYLADSDEEEDEQLDFGEDDEKEAQGESEEEGKDEEQEEGDDEESRRAITYQIAKNKGLTPHRKKELRNPRVKHRSKYRKALIRRKGAVRTVRKEVRRYDGEISGIKSNVSKSIKIKV